MFQYLKTWEDNHYIIIIIFPLAEVVITLSYSFMHTFQSNALKPTRFHKCPYSIHKPVWRQETSFTLILSNLTSITSPNEIDWNKINIIAFAEPLLSVEACEGCRILCFVVNSTQDQSRSSDSKKYNKMDLKHDSIVYLDAFLTYQMHIIRNFNSQITHRYITSFPTLFLSWYSFFCLQPWLPNWHNMLLFFLGKLIKEEWYPIQE